MKKIRLYWFVAAAMLAAAGLAACGDDENDDKPEDSTDGELVERTVTGGVDKSLIGGLDGCEVNTFTGTWELDEGRFSADVPSNDLAQTFIVGNEAGDVFLLARGPLEDGQEVSIDVRSTALGMVTLHPLFAPMGGDDYREAVEMITSSPKFEAFRAEVERTVEEGRPLFDESNERLLIAFGDLMESLCGDVDEEVYTDSLDVLPAEEALSRAVSEDSPYYPFHAEVWGNTLTLRNTGLTPSYYGTVRRPDGGEEGISVPSRGDYGGMDIFTKSLEEFTLGDPIEYEFSVEGNHRFYLSRTNTAATADYYLQLANSLLSALGVELETHGAIMELGNMLNSALINQSAGVKDGSIDVMTWVGIGYDVLWAWGEKQGDNVLLASAAKFMVGSLNWYNKAKGIVNTALRIAYALTAPEEVRFCLCFHDNHLSTCMNAELKKIDGDEQKGYAKQMLLLPLKVKVTTYDEEGNEVRPGEFHRVKFEVAAGGGKIKTELVAADSTGMASTNWTLGKEGEQRVKVSVVDVITGQEIAMPVYFTAEIEKADVTVRLDWTRVDGYTDIDLHVVDPFGERIYFDHEASASGGFLDRDDTEGPGPEHIHWDDAPAGTYKIYVHYYDSESAAMTNYKVSVTAGGVTYKPVTGSITYDQMVGIGQFTIGNGDSEEETPEVQGSRVVCDDMKPTGKTKKRGL